VQGARKVPYAAGMSIEVQLDALAKTLAGFGFGYVLTARDDGRSHISAVHATVAEGGLRVVDAGDRTRANITARPEITMLFPPVQAGGYSLIVDGVATLGAGDITLAPTRAVLHRPAPPRATAPDPAGACQEDCVEVPLT
jgi:hypothetical protein